MIILRDILDNKSGIPDRSLGLGQITDYSRWQGK